MYIMPTRRPAGRASVGNSGLGIEGGGLSSSRAFNERLSVAADTWPALADIAIIPTIAKIKGIIHRLRFITSYHLGLFFNFRAVLRYEHAVATYPVSYRIVSGIPISSGPWTTVSF